jgi:hypothetical protein
MFPNIGRNMGSLEKAGRHCAATEEKKEEPRMTTPEPARIPMGPEQYLREQLSHTGEPATIQRTLLQQIAQALAGRVVSTQDIALVVHRVVRDSGLPERDKEELTRHVPTWIRAITPLDHQEEALNLWRGFSFEAVRSQRVVNRNEQLRRISWGCLITAIVAEVAYVVAVAATAESFGTVSRSFFVLFAVAVVVMASVESVCELRSSVRHLAWVSVMGTLAAIVVVLAFVR